MTGIRYSTEEMLARLIAFDTTSRDGNIPLIEFVEDYLDGWGVPHFRVDYEANRKTNLFATIGPAIAELFPERDNLELTISPRDAAFLEQLKPAWLDRYPGLKLRTDAALAPGDCQVRSRFGLTDARQQTKLTALAHSLHAT